jgi:DNA replication and repair protein RecF
MAQLLKNNARRDRQLERTSSGIHRDDVDFLIEGKPLKKFASQGQQKSFLFALKFTQYLFIREAVGASPILLLDDFFDKIDESRVANIVGWLSRNDIGQMFITDTGLERMPLLLKRAGLDFKAWRTEVGKLDAI